MKTTSTQKRVMSRAANIAATTGCSIQLYANAYRGELAIAVHAPEGMYFEGMGGATTVYQWYTDRSWKQLRHSCASLTTRKVVQACCHHLVA